MPRFFFALFLLFTIHYSLFTTFASAACEPDGFNCPIDGCNTVALGEDCVNLRPSDLRTQQCNLNFTKCCVPLDNDGDGVYDDLCRAIPTPTSVIVFPTFPPVPTSAALCTAPPTKPGIKTPIGCLPYAENQNGGLPGRAMISALLAWGVRVGGILALLLFVSAGYTWVTGRGDPHKIQAGRELTISALLGLTLIVLALVTLNFIGIRVLNLTLLGFNL